MRKVKFAAHRGYMEFYPENTMVSYKAALAQPVDQVEIDLHMTSDGEIVMIHDHTVDRTTNGTGWVKDKTLAEKLQMARDSKKSKILEKDKEINAKYK